MRRSGPEASLIVPSLMGDRNVQAAALTGGHAINHRGDSVWHLGSRRGHNRKEHLLMRWIHTPTLKRLGSALSVVVSSAG